MQTVHPQAALPTTLGFYLPPSLILKMISYEVFSSFLLLTSKLFSLVSKSFLLSFSTSLLSIPFSQRDDQNPMWHSLKESLARNVSAPEPFQNSPSPN